VVTFRRRAVLAAARIPYVYGLTKLGQIYGTDKVDARHTHNGLAYTEIYERYLQSWRWRRFTLLELGVFRGDSLRMWNAFFPRATVVGLDLEQLAAERAPEFEVTVGSQADPDVLESMLRRHPDVSLVVDDASHITSLTIASFRYLFPRLRRGGLYIMEDIAPNTYEDWPGHDAERGANWPAIEQNPGESPFNRRQEMDDFLRELVRDCDLGGGAFGEGPGMKQVAFVHVWPAIIVVGRA
jgi:demethylmacrocin O-methyltransferase